MRVGRQSSLCKLTLIKMVDLTNESEVVSMRGMSEPWVPSPGRGRINQKQRTRRAIVDAARRLAASGREVTMPLVAREALVSEATAYRYFPDLASLLTEADEGTWPSPED